MSIVLAVSKASSSAPGRHSSATNLGRWITACFLVHLLVSPFPESQAAGIANGSITYASRKHIFTMSNEGSNVRRITDTNTHNRTPAWSPDGSVIAYGCLGDQRSERDICISRSDGSRRRNVTGDATPDRDPDWAPGGRRIVFSRQVGTVHQLFVMRRDGSALRQVTMTATDARDPEWSPDGATILFVAVGPLGGPDIFSVRPNGQDQSNLTLTQQYEGAPAWSPDGTAIVFARDGQLMTMGADGSDPKGLGIRGHNPKWAPDGSRILAHRLRESSYQRCFSARLDGSRVKWLSPEGKQCYSPDWAPRV